METQEPDEDRQDFDKVISHVFIEIVKAIDQNKIILFRTIKYIK